MSYKIDSMTQQFLKIAGRSSETNPQGTVPQNAASPEKAKAAALNDTITFTESARLMQAVEARLAEVSEVDQLKVEDVRNRIESGSYQVSYERLADKMIAMDNSLPVKK